MRKYRDYNNYEKTNIRYNHSIQATKIQASNNSELGSSKFIKYSW